jgi:hypothetical protein
VMVPVGRAANPDTYNPSNSHKRYNFLSRVRMAISQVTKIL